MRARKEERNKRALELRRSGMYIKDVAKEIGVCYARARTIILNQERWEREESEVKRDDE